MINFRSLSTAVLTAAVVVGLGAVAAPSASATQDQCRPWTDGSTYGYRCTYLGGNTKKFYAIVWCSNRDQPYDGNTVNLGETSYVWCSKYGATAVKGSYAYAK